MVANLSYQFIHRQNIAYFRAAHPSFNYLVLGSSIFALPLLLLFAPLPGYLLMDVTRLDGQVLGATLFLILALVLSQFYWYWWRVEQLQYFRYLHGRWRYWWLHLQAFSPYACTYCVVALAVVLQPLPQELPEWAYVVYAFTLMLLLIVVMVLSAYWKLSDTKRWHLFDDYFWRMAFSGISMQVIWRLFTALLLTPFTIYWWTKVRYEAVTISLGLLLIALVSYLFSTALLSHFKGVRTYQLYGNYVVADFQFRLALRIVLMHLIAWGNVAWFSLLTM